jgi:hypothetical protein
MDVHFQDEDLCRTCNHSAAMTKEWGEEAAVAVGQHLQELEAVETLADVAQFPHLRVTGAGDAHAWVQATSGVRIGVRWDTSDQSDDPEDTWGDVTVIVVETIAVNRGEANA